MKTYTLKEVIDILEKILEKVYGCGNGRNEIGKMIKQLQRDE
jgi:hypothetical protein